MCSSTINRGDYLGVKVLKIHHHAILSEFQMICDMLSVTTLGLL